MRAGIHARVSQDQGGRSRSVPEQVEESMAWAAREGWDVVEVIRETGSASRYAKTARPGWDALVELVSSGRIDVLLTWEHSRATRSLEAYTDLRRLCAENNVSWGYMGTVYDLAKRADRFRTGLDALLAEDESARNSERIQRTMRSRALEGSPVGRLPYGYRRVYDDTTGELLRQVPDEETAPVVQEIYRRVVAGDPIYRIAADLTARGVPTPRPPLKRSGAAGWLPASVKRMVQRPTYAGLRVHRGEVIGEAQWPGLVERDTWEQAQAVLQHVSAGQPRIDRAVKQLLSGIAKCGECGGPMVHHTDRGFSTYACKYCSKVTRRRIPVDEHVVERLMFVLSNLDTPDPDTATPELLEAEAEVTALRARLRGFVDGAADGAVSLVSLARIEAKLLPQIEEAEQRARRLRRPPFLASLDLSDPIAMWRGMDLGQQRTLLAEAVTVRILKAGPQARGRKTFDPNLIDVRPRW
ncbi:recombinase family protein [Phycicoccus sp. HDW14]|uniref:recombinase family protein n=1 Tax=Phycicoccus sp. HDW14 TaxID=2714941 RepID=UPI00140D6C86|nr:recombinase family protein [Phycicoccus sp. HDW14]QIM19914.1 recombinase family protein [Phycicoccus sp. HDW14]